MNETPVPPLEPGPPRHIQPTLVTWLILSVAAAMPVLIMLNDYAVSVAVGGILAVLFQPPYTRLRRHLPPWAAALTVTLGVVVLVLVPVTVLSVGAFRQGMAAVSEVLAGDTPTLSEAIERLRRWMPFTDTLGTPDEIRAVLTDGARTASQAASGAILSRVQAIPELVLQLVITVLSTYFLLVDGRRLFHWIGGRLPLSRQIRGMLVASFRSATTAVVLASVAAAAVQSLMLLLGYWLIGVPGALLAAGSTFVLAWIPTVGTVPIWGGAAVWLYLQGSPVRCGIMVVLGLLVGVADNVVRPLVLRGRQEMHPLVSLIAILGGLGWMGIPGLFIGPLLVSSAIALFEIWPAVASYCGIPVSGAGEDVPDVPMLGAPR